MPMLRYDHWQQFPLANWRWPSFSPEELRNRDPDNPELIIDIDAGDRLQQLRDLLGHPIIVVSAGRTPEWNRHVGGAKNSQHLKGRAFDVSMENQDPVTFEATARAVGFTGFGYYPGARRPFMHIDTGPARSWGKRFPPRKPAPVPRPRPHQDEETEVDLETVAAPAEERFPAEPKKPSWIETILKPEVWLPGGLTGISVPSLLKGIGDLVQDSVPLQIGAAVLVAALPIGVIIWLATRQRGERSGD